MLMELLAFYEQASTVVKGYWEVAKHYTRIWLGPEPQNWFLMADGRILPSTVTLPDSVCATTYEYDPHTNRMKLANDTEEGGRFRPMPYLSLVVEDPDVGNTDLSDWLGEIRVKPVPTSMRVEQMISLWSLTHNEYIPITNITVRYTTSDGTETVRRID